MSASRPILINDGKLHHQAIATELRKCVDIILRKAHFDLSYDIKITPPGGPAALENPEVLLVFRGRQMDLLLERNAELLKAMEHIALRWLRIDPQFYDRVRFDAGGYRAMRIEELKISARVAAERVREIKTPFRFNSMSARERRILHLVLKEEPGVRTSSEGSGEDRQVIVYPAE
jgi:spoIIIJ-associated protein